MLFYVMPLHRRVGGGQMNRRFLFKDRKSSITSCTIEHDISLSCVYNMTVVFLLNSPYDGFEPTSPLASTSHHTHHIKLLHQINGFRIIILPLL